MAALGVYTPPHQRIGSTVTLPRSGSDLPSENRYRLLTSSLTPNSVVTSTTSTDVFVSSNSSGATNSGFKSFVRNHRLCDKSSLRWFILAILLTILWFLLHNPDGQTPLAVDLYKQHDSKIDTILQPTNPHQGRKIKNDPITWLERYSDNAFAVDTKSKHIKKHRGTLSRSRPRAALISLVRNEELEGILQSMRQLEFRWNRKYQYPWIFFNEKPFSDEFKAATSNATSAVTMYEVVPKSHWSTPQWIDQNKYMDSLDYLGTIGVGKGWMLSYRNMCRWNSGFFYKHPALKNYDYYWRVEPDVHFFCDIDYDPFRFMDDNDLIYGFNMNILEDARSFPSLWASTIDFVRIHPDLIHPQADLNWLVNPSTGGDYNNCQFFSNFEIGSLNFFRSKNNERYFEWLDQQGGFYYERFGDAPIHTLSVSMFAPKGKTWFFRDIGYQHDIARHCPPNQGDRCACEPTKLDENFYKLVPMESPQKKPDDTCIRQWLGGNWLEKKAGWDQEIERLFGGDGYSGYVKEL